MNQDNNGGLISEHLKICFYYPNIVGYLRFLSAFAAVYYAFQEKNWVEFTLLYSISQALDAVDGKLARMFD